MSKTESKSPLPAPGAVVVPEPGLRMILAGNPSPMTGRGTNTYLVGTGDVAIIDPGPTLPAHMGAILSALGPDERITHILVTHSHLDHSPLARPLADATGAPVLGFGPPESGRSPIMRALADQGAVSGGEGVDLAFRPDILLAEGDRIAAGNWTLTAHHTPGHFGNHLSFSWQNNVFCGDTVMGWASSLVSPPDGDMGAYMASLRRLAAMDARRLYSGHGDPVTTPGDRIDELITHRLGRETAILAALADGPSDATALARRIYTDTPERMMPAAARNVLAHLIDLTERNLISPNGRLTGQARFRLL